MTIHPTFDMPTPRSLALRMDITNNCNLDCIGCALADDRQFLKQPAAVMKLELLEKIANEVFPYLREATLSCEAEPTLHPQFTRIMEIIGAKTNRNADFPVRMTTNGTLLTAPRLNAIFESGLSVIAISIDGFEPETFSRLRKGGDIATVFDALDEITRRKKSLGLRRLDYPRLQINYTLMKSNLCELIPLIEYSRRWEMENFTVVHVYSTGSKDMSHESLADCREDTDCILIEAKRKCLEYGIVPRFPQLFRTSSPSAPDPSFDLSCSAPWRMVKIRWNGDVYPCDLWRSTDNFGSIQTQSFESIWMSSRYKELRSGLMANAPTFGDCIDCDRISHDNLEGRKIQTPLTHTAVNNFESILSRIINRKSG